MRCSARDEGRPFGTALRREVPNHRVLRWLKTVVVSDTEKAHLTRQVGIGKTVRSLDSEIAVPASQTSHVLRCQAATCWAGSFQATASS